MGILFKGRWAVVTGASVGIGRSLCMELAKQGTNLALVARREDKLRELSALLERQYGVQTIVVPMDLAVPGAGQALQQALGQFPISILVNNAGFGMTGPFSEADPAELERMLALNVGFLTQFTRAMLPRLKQFKEGAYILNLGSIAGFQGVPGMLAYAATKSYVNHFSEGLAWELAGSKVQVTCLQPGKTESEFFDVAGIRGSGFARSNVMNADTVAKTGLKAMAMGKRNVITGVMNKLSIFGLRIFPRWFVGLTMRFLFKEMIRTGS